MRPRDPTVVAAAGERPKPGPLQWDNTVFWSNYTQQAFYVKILVN